MSYSPHWLPFDAIGNRIGMGGGYYDRSFRFMRSRTSNGIAQH